MLENKIQWLLLLNQRENAWQMRWACSLPSLFVGHIPAEPISNTQTSKEKRKKEEKKKKEIVRLHSWAVGNMTITNLEHMPQQNGINVGRL